MENKKGESGANGNLNRQKKYHRKRRSKHHERLMIALDAETHRIADKVARERATTMQDVVNDALINAAKTVKALDEDNQFGCWLTVPAAQSIEHIMSYTGMTQRQAVSWALRQAEPEPEKNATTTLWQKIAKWFC